MSTESMTIVAAGDAPPSWWRRVNKSDLVITVVLLGVFIAGLIAAQEWKPLAAFFPIGVNVVGIGTTAVFLIRVLFFPRSADAPKTNVPKEAPGSSSDQEYEFFSALTRRDWLNSIVWLGGFYVLMVIAGIYVALLAFTILYLMKQAQKSLRFAVIYAVLLVGLIFVAFNIVLTLPLPAGVLGLG